MKILKKVLEREKKKKKMKNRFYNSLENKKFLRTLIFLAIPMILGELMAHSVNFVDMWMVGQLSLESITGLGLSKRLFFLFIMLVFGINSGGAVFMGQYWGKGDVTGIHRVLGIALSFNLAVSAIFAGIAIFAPRWFMSILTSNPAVIEEGVRYLAVASITYFLTSISFTIVVAMRSIRQTKLPMISSFFALLTKIAVNYLLIFVLDMGIVGAAWGTVASRSIEICVQIYLIKRHRLPIFTHWRKHFAFDVGYLKKFAKTALPVVGNEFAWGLGIFMYEVAYQFTGTAGQGALQLSENIQHIFMIAGISTGAASGIIIANHLGAGEKEAAIKASRRCVAIGTVITAFMAIVLFLTAPFIVSTYGSISSEVQAIASSNLMIIALFMIPRTINYYFIISILRQGGDTMFCLLLDTGSVWLIGIPLAFLGAYVLGLPIYLVLTLVYIEEVVKFFIAGHRVRKNKWANKLV